MSIHVSIISVAYDHGGRGVRTLNGSGSSLRARTLRVWRYGRPSRRNHFPRDNNGSMCGPVLVEIDMARGMGGHGDRTESPTADG